MIEIDRSHLPPALHLGTSSFSTPDWRGAFYPPAMKPADFLSFYAARFDTVEIDSTWHALPARRVVEGWARKVPESFVFSLKVPKEITHTRYLEGCDAEWERFLEVLEPLGTRRGPLLFQFPYVAKGKDPAEYASGDDFRRRLAAFLPRLPAGGRYVVEVRNEKWLAPPLLDLLRSRGIALGLVAYYTMPRPEKLLQTIDPVTAPFGYLRFLGDHRAMETLVARARKERGKERDWDELMLDRGDETRAWVHAAGRLLDRFSDFYVYFNNHFAGFAPGSADLFVRTWAQERPV